MPFWIELSHHVFSQVFAESASETWVFDQTANMASNSGDITDSSKQAGLPFNKRVHRSRRGVGDHREREYSRFQYNIWQSFAIAGEQQQIHRAVVLPGIAGESRPVDRRVACDAILYFACHGVALLKIAHQEQSQVGVHPLNLFEDFDQVECTPKLRQMKVGQFSVNGKGVPDEREKR